MEKFQGRVAVVTGAASGIGRALAVRCLQEGMKVVLADVESEALQQTLRELAHLGEAVAIETDVSKREQVQSLAQNVMARYGAIHLLVNNAGVSAGDSAWDSTWNDWEWVLDVNLWGVIHGLKIFTPLMLAGGQEGHILNTSSQVGLLPYHPQSPYHVSKAAVLALSENLQVSLAARNSRIKVSVLCPGPVRTRILSSERSRPEARRNVSPSRLWEGHLKIMRPFIEAGKSPEEVADLAFVAIREERFYIYTEAEFPEQVQQRMEDLVAQRHPRRI